MCEFQQYLGFLLFLTVLTIGFWLMIFLITAIIPYWVFGGMREFLKERKANKEKQQ
jgi:predicted membrane protein